LALGIYNVFLLIGAMRRVTFSLEEADHLALKLLAIHERKAMVAVVQEAIRTYLENKEAYLLTVSKGDGR
jgi:predicted component of type VI protein secretion system